MAADPVYGGFPKSQARTFVNGHSTRPRPIWTPGASGSRVFFASMAASLATNPTLYLAEQMTLQSAMGTGAHVDGGGGSDTITRSSGSFVTDGWQIGDILWVLGSTTLANDYKIQLTNVASGTLTFATATVTTAENLPSGSILYRLHQLVTVAGASNTGNSTTVPATNLLDIAMVPALFPGSDAALFVPPTWLLTASLSSAPSSSQFVTIICKGQDA